MRSLAFIDLDLTLFDYTSARRESTHAALESLGVGTSARELYRFAETVIIPHAQMLADFGLPDFRRAWKSPEVFALLDVLSSRADARRDCAGIAEHLTRIEKVQEDETADRFDTRIRRCLLLARRWQESLLCGAFAEAQARLQDRAYRLKLSQAIAGFERHFSGNRHLREGIPELMGALRGHGFEVYIVSEGDEDIQTDKIRVLEIDRLVDAAFVSGGCVRSQRLLNWLWRVGRASYQAGARGKDRAAASGILFNEVLEYSVKSPTLYRKVAHSAVLSARKRPGFYRNFSWLSQAECREQGPVRVLLLGDRYEKDLLPAMTAFGEVTSVRLLAGKYRGEYSQTGLRALKLPLPTATVRSLNQAAVFIRRRPGGEISKSNRLSAMRETEGRIRRVRKAVEVLQQSGACESEEILLQMAAMPAALLGSE